MELSNEFFQILYELPIESEIIIKDEEVYEELNLKEFIIPEEESRMYVDIEHDRIHTLIGIYIKKLFPEDDHIMLYDHKMIYSYSDCLNYLRKYNYELYVYQSNYKLFVDDEFYKDIYLNCKYVNTAILFIKPRKFDVFKTFINEYYEFIINRLKLTIKYITCNMRLYDEPLQPKYFSNEELLELLTMINELLAIKLSFIPFREYGIPVKLSHKINLISNKILKKYISKHLSEVLIDIKILLIEYYKYEYAYHLLPMLSINTIATKYNFE
jgi:hypothetical protein